MTIIRFKHIDIIRVTNSSGVHTGVNIQHKWNNRKSSSEGFGTVEGNSNKISNIVSFSDRKNRE
jgi:hypothetical protein